MNGFDKVLGLLVKKVKEDELFLVLMPPFDVTFEPVDANLVTEEAKNVGL